MNDYIICYVYSSGMLLKQSQVNLALFTVYIYIYCIYINIFESRERRGRGLKCRGIRVFNNKIKQNNKNHPEGEKQAEDWCTVKHDTLYERHTKDNGSAEDYRPQEVK